MRPSRRNAVAVDAADQRQWAHARREGSVHMETKNLAELYDLPPIPWERARQALESGEPQKQTTFLATTRPDGRPHLTGVGALWDDGKAYIVSGPDTRKSRNLAENPNCAISMAY